MDGAEWVVLSGCDTGTGELLSGEGVLGLRRAFEMAGARTQIVSLWEVRDDDTAQWMSSLYSARWKPSPKPTGWRSPVAAARG
jgi:CHAT domain-containing protein